MQKDCWIYSNYKNLFLLPFFFSLFSEICIKTYIKHFFILFIIWNFLKILKKNLLSKCILLQQIIKKKCRAKQKWNFTMTSIFSFRNFFQIFLPSFIIRSKFFLYFLFFFLLSVFDYLWYFTFFTWSLATS